MFCKLNLLFDQIVDGVSNEPWEDRCTHFWARTPHWFPFIATLSVRSDIRFLSGPEVLSGNRRPVSLGSELWTTLIYYPQLHVNQKFVKAMFLFFKRTFALDHKSRAVLLWFFFVDLIAISDITWSLRGQCTSRWDRGGLCGDAKSHPLTSLIVRALQSRTVASECSTDPPIVTWWKHGHISADGIETELPPPTQAMWATARRGLSYFSLLPSLYSL